MEFSLSAAAKAVGKGKSTIHHAIKTGKLSARRADDGSYKIDASELARVFNLNPTGGSGSDAVEPPNEPPGSELVVLRMQVSMLEMKISMQDEQLVRERETVDDLRKRLDRAEERILALSPPRAAERGQERPVEPLHGMTLAKPSRSFLARLFGR